jgi:hydrogenase maturation factor
LTSVLSEIATAARLGILIEESQIPISEEVKGACEILGLHPLYVASEGTLLAFVPAGVADRYLPPCESIHSEKKQQSSERLLRIIRVWFS